MSLLGFTLDPFGTVNEVIKSWQPKGCKEELDYRDSLYKEIQEKLKDQKVQKEYGRGRQRWDLVVEDKVPIELKMGKKLKNISELHRLIGQMEGYQKHTKSFFLVICGDMPSDVHKDLEKYTNNKNEDEWFESGIKIILKKQVDDMINIHIKNLGNNNYEIIKSFNNEYKVGDKLTEKDIKEINNKKIPGTKISYFYQY